MPTGIQLQLCITILRWSNAHPPYNYTGRVHVKFKLGIVYVLLYVCNPQLY